MMPLLYRIYAFAFFRMFLVIMPVIVPFFSSLGLSMQQVFQLQAIFGISVVVFEVPTGYISDLWGRKKALLLGSFASGVSFSFLLFADSFVDLMVFEIVVAFGFSLKSGSDVSLMYDSLPGEGRAQGTRALANLQLAAVLGEAAASILGGILVVFSFRSVLIANAVALWIPFLIATTFVEPEIKRMDSRTHAHNFKRVFRHVFGEGDKLLRLTFINLVLWGLATFFAVWMMQKYWELNDIPLAYFGGLWALYNLTVGVAGTQVHRLEQRVGPVPLLAFLALAPILAYAGMAFTGGAVGVAIGLLFYLSRGINHVLLRDILNWKTPSEFRATVNSLHSFFFRLGFAISGPGVGFVMDRYGMRPALLMLAAVFTVLFLLVMFPLMRAVRANALNYIPSGSPE